MSIIRHKYINKVSRIKNTKKSRKSKPLNKTIKTGNKNLDTITNKRYLFISCLLIFSFLIIAIRLFKLQVLEYTSYSDALSKATEKTVEGTSTPRGRIYDRNYKLLVDNEAKKTIY